MSECQNPDHLNIVEAWREHRGSGRTSRLLRDALIRAAVGQRVIVVFPTEYMGEEARRSVALLAHRLGVPTEAEDRISYIGERKWRQGGYDASPNPPVLLLDHTVSGEEQ